MIKFKTINTKSGKEYIYSEKEIEQLFDCDSFRSNFILTIELKDYLNSLEDEEERRAVKDYWKATGREVINSACTFLKEMIEYETWCSPRGIEPVFKVIDVVND